MLNLAKIMIVRRSDLHRAVIIARGAVQALLATLPPSHPEVTNAQEFVRNIELFFAQKST